MWTSTTDNNPPNALWTYFLLQWGSTSVSAQPSSNVVIRAHTVGQTLSKHDVVMPIGAMCCRTNCLTLLTLVRPEPETINHCPNQCDKADDSNCPSVCHNGCKPRWSSGEVVKKWVSSWMLPLAVKLCLSNTFKTPDSFILFLVQSRLLIDERGNISSSSWQQFVGRYFYRFLICLFLSPSHTLFTTTFSISQI